MADYAEIEDPKALARLNRELAGKLRTALRHAERRDIGWPAGRFSTRTSGHCVALEVNHEE